MLASGGGAGGFSADRREWRDLRGVRVELGVCVCVWRGGGPNTGGFWNKTLMSEEGGKKFQSPIGTKGQVGVVAALQRLPLLPGWPTFQLQPLNQVDQTVTLSQKTLR